MMLVPTERPEGCILVFWATARIWKTEEEDSILLPASIFKMASFAEHLAERRKEHYTYSMFD